MVMLTLARKAFAPGPIPFPLVVIDTRWKFQDMYRFREYLQDDPQLSVIVYVNPEAIERDVNPFLLVQPLTPTSQRPKSQASSR